MNRTLRVSVKSEHVEEGACKAPQRCMIARAIRAADPSVRFVCVRTNGIKITRSKTATMNERELWAIPLEAAKAIIEFDQGKSPVPFRFTAKLVERKMIAKATAEEKAKSSIRTKRRRAGRAARGLPQQEQRIAGV